MKKTFYFSALLFFFSCGNDGSNVQFRIKNNLGESISRCYLGKRIYKGSNSYATKSYAVKWTDLADGELTEYKKTKGKFWGYTNCSLEFFGENAKYPHQANAMAMQAAIDELDIELLADSVKHPYTKEMIHNNRLPDGKYTLTIEGFDTTYAQSILVRISKDK